MSIRSSVGTLQLVFIALKFCATVAQLSPSRTLVKKEGFILQYA
jgi:hypothetical protein